MFLLNFKLQDYHKNLQRQKAEQWGLTVNRHEGISWGDRNVLKQECHDGCS